MKVTPKKRYSIKEIYVITMNAFRSVKDLKKSRKRDEMSKELLERIMLAVTSVNDCEMCTYAHTKMALEAGLSNEEIKSLLASEIPDVAVDDAKALLFAQHYADTRANVSKKAWVALIKHYGKQKSRGILAAIRMIMMGNAMGIILGSIKSRLGGKKGDTRSSILYELSFIVLFIPIIVSGFLHAFLLNFFKVPIIKFPHQ